MPGAGIGDELGYSDRRTLAGSDVAAR